MATVYAEVLSQPLLSGLSGKKNPRPRPRVASLADEQVKAPLREVKRGAIENRP